MGLKFKRALSGILATYRILSSGKIQRIDYTDTKKML